MLRLRIVCYTPRKEKRGNKMIDVFTPEKSEGIMIVMSGAPQEKLWNDKKMWIDKKMRNECWKGYHSYNHTFR